MIHQPTAEEQRLEQRRKDVQKWLTEGSKTEKEFSSIQIDLLLAKHKINLMKEPETPQYDFANPPKAKLNNPLIGRLNEAGNAIANWAGETYGSKTVYRSKAYLYPESSTNIPFPGITIRSGMSHSIVESAGKEKPIMTFVETDQDQKSKVGVYNSYGDFRIESGIKDTNSRLFFSEIPSKVFYNQYSYSHDNYTDSLSLMTNGLEVGIGIYNTNHIDDLEEVSYTEIMINKVDIIATVLFYFVTQGAGSPSPVPGY